jgi:curved DNA-binding protein CbpA
MANFINYYKILQVDSSADQAVIAAAFRKLSSLYHPDISKDLKAEAKYKLITEAYFVLKDKEKRKRYDEIYSQNKKERKFCVECGKEIEVDSEESYCQKCSDYLDEKFSFIQIEILKNKRISEEQIKFLDKFEKEEIIDLYLELRDSFIIGDGIKKNELTVLLKLQKTFNLDVLKII